MESTEIMEPAVSSLTITPVFRLYLISFKKYTLMPVDVKQRLANKNIMSLHTELPSIHISVIGFVRARFFPPVDVRLWPSVVWRELRGHKI